MKNPRLSIVIPTKNRRDSLEKVLNGLVKQTFKDFEIIISDANSDDGTKKMLDIFGKKLTIRLADGNGGLVLAMNNACKEARGEFITRTDDDVLVDKDWLKNIISTFDSDKKIGGVTGPTIIPADHIKNRDIFSSQEQFKHGNLIWKMLGKIYYDFFMEGESLRVSHWFRCGAFSLGSNYESCLKIKEPIEVDNLEACNYSVRKDLLKKVGWFDPRYSGVGEYHEPDAAFKIKDLGYKLIFNPKAIVHHCPVQTGIYKARPKSFSRAQNFVNFYFRHIKPDTFDKTIRFSSYLFFINGYWFYKFLTTKQWRELGAIPGTISAVFNNIFKD
jgi:O-antigen biosynthesis protein